jgi:hypothetical protein
MFIPDFINGLYESGGGLMHLLNVKALVKDKKVSGVRILPQVFFSSWGIWNLYYYPHLGQWLSFIGGLLIVAANILWVGLAVYYTRKNKSAAYGTGTRRKPTHRPAQAA